MSLIGKGAPQGGDTSAMGPDMMGGQGMGQEPNMKLPAEDQDPTQYGVTADNTKELVGAISSLHKYIKNITNPDNIQKVRDILVELIKIMQEDQAGANSSAPAQSALQEAVATPPQGA